MSVAEKAETAWNGAPPDWIVKLATACDATSQSIVARELRVNGGYLSYALRNQKPEYHQRVRDATRARLMGETVCCPVLGNIALDLCAAHRRSRLKPTGPAQRELRATCPNCIHNQNSKGDDHAE